MPKFFRVETRDRPDLALLGSTSQLDLMGYAFPKLFPLLPVTEKGGTIDLDGLKARFVLLPVWLLSTRWKDENFLFAMNGQTGKLVGDLPVDKKKKWLLFGGVFAASAALFLLSGIGNALGSLLSGLLG